MQFKTTQAPKSALKQLGLMTARVGCLGVLVPLPFMEQPGELGNAVPALNLNGFDFCGFVSPFMLIK